MKIFNRVLLICFSLWLAACENEVDINTDYKEVTLVYGLLDKNADTQFVKINRTFLDDNLSAIDLAKQTERFNYDTLTVNLIDQDNKDTFRLRKIIKPKEPGLFSTEENILYYTTEKLLPKTKYRLTIEKPDGSFTYASATTIDTVQVLEPKVQFGEALSINNIRFVNVRGNQITTYPFKFSVGRNVAEFDIKLHFYYWERTGVGPTGEEQRVVSMNVGKLFNSLENDREQPVFPYSGALFLKAIEEQVPESDNPTEKVIRSISNIEIEIVAADPDYRFYRQLNGPLDGLAQTRPEFTNVENGIGLFASKLRMVVRTQLQEETRNFLISNYKERRNFSGS